jgi:hypothetical protein
MAIRHSYDLSSITKVLTVHRFLGYPNQVPPQTSSKTPKDLHRDLGLISKKKEKACKAPGRF